MLYIHQTVEYCHAFGMPVQRRSGQAGRGAKAPAGGAQHGQEGRAHAAQQPLADAAAAAAAAGCACSGASSASTGTAHPARAATVCGVPQRGSNDFGSAAAAPHLEKALMALTAMAESFGVCTRHTRAASLAGRQRLICSHL